LKLPEKHDLDDEQKITAGHPGGRTAKRSARIVSFAEKMYSTRLSGFDQIDLQCVRLDGSVRNQPPLRRRPVMKNKKHFLLLEELPETSGGVPGARNAACGKG